MKKDKYVVEEHDDPNWPGYKFKCYEIWFNQKFIKRYINKQSADKRCKSLNKKLERTLK